VSAVEERQARAAARVDELAKAMRTGEPPAAADPVPVVKQKSKRRPSQARPRAAPLDAATADPILHAEFGIRELTQHARYANNSRIYFADGRKSDEFV